MSFEAAVGRWRKGERFDISNFTKSLAPEWIDEGLTATGKASLRGRRFPAEKVIWLVLGMALFSDRSMVHVVEHLGLVVGKLFAPSALSQARARLTSEPVKWLFERIAQAWSALHETRWRGLSLYGVDGSHQRVDDSDANFKPFGKPKGRTDGGYPQLRFVALMNLTSRLLSGVAIGSWDVGEVTLARQLWEQIPDQSLTLVDRGFLSFFIWFELLSKGSNRHFLCRGKKNSKYKVTKVLPDGTAMATMESSSAARKNHPELPARIIVRVIAYQHRDGKPGVVFTSLIDPVAFPAAEILALYHKRWELELAFDELKTHMLHRKEALRSRLPDGVYQELWGILLVYNLVRREMQLVALKHDLPPARISFTGALLLIQNFFLAAPMAAPGKLPTHLAQLDEQLKSSILPPRRSDRRNPRHVKIKMSQYAKNPGKRGLAA